MIKCSQCQFDNKDGAELCLNCGAPLSQMVEDEEEFSDVSDEATVLINPAAMQARIKSELDSRAGSGSAPKQNAAPPQSSPPQQEAPKAAPSIPQQQSQQPPQQQQPVPGGTNSNQLTIILLTLIILIVLVIVGIVILLVLK